MKKCFIVLALLMLVVSGMKSQTTLNTAVNFTANDAYGNSHTLFNYLDSNKFVVIMFTVSWCLSCEAVYPIIQDSYEHFGCHNSNVITMVVSDDHLAHQMQGIIGDFIKIPAQTPSLITTYGIGAFPTIILIAPNRNIVEKDIWPISETILRTAIANAGGTPFTCSANIEENPVSVFNIYPNPVVDVLYFSNEQNATVYLFDITGRMIDSFKINSNFSYNCAHLAPGIYTIRAYSEERQLISVKKILKK